MQTSEQAESRRSAVAEERHTSEEYNRVGLALSLFAALCFFSALWFVNGFFTARTIVTLSGLSWGAGWLAHIVISLIEHHLWRMRATVSRMPRAVLLGIYALIICVGIADVLTSAIAFLMLFAGAGISPVDTTTQIVSIVLAETIAILPEPTIVWLTIALWRVVRN
jgi:hypothetical protein